MPALILVLVLMVFTPSLLRYSTYFLWLFISNRVAKGLRDVSGLLEWSNVLRQLRF